MFDMVLDISCFAVVLRGFSQDCLIYAKLIIVFTPNRIFPLFRRHTWKYNIQANKRSTKVKEK